MTEYGVRVIVDRVDRSRTGTKVGDFFDVFGSTVSMPPGTSFNVYAMNAVFPVISDRLREPDGDDWLSRKPYICSADPEENIVMRLDRIPVSQIDYLPGERADA
ncbi:TIGR04076 family protein [Subtercola frigoramans]|uniref:Repeat protein (TIGR04076 family) n=1 Tax=Subtercola frigoramans TaxID=120298 RepID=A0ABS2L7E3_9MICO|nr:TIGR04076 family protein [Subtercola frigoramans]MBM7473021.1 putative repeat protein (TIGR04076 family) [Subtercola frigoramans]